MEKKWSERKSKNEQLEKCYARLTELEPHTEEYAAITNQILELHKSDKPKVNPNTILTCAASTGTVIAVIIYEAFGNIIKTKALSLIPKIRL